MTLPEGDYLYSTCLNNLALLYQDMTLYEKAITLHEENIYILSKRDDSKSRSKYAATLVNLAMVQIKLKLYVEAELSFFHALGIYEELLGKEHSLYAGVLNNLGSLYDMTNCLEKVKGVHEDCCNAGFENQ